MALALTQGLPILNSHCVPHLILSITSAVFLEPSLGTRTLPLEDLVI